MERLAGVDGDAGHEGGRVYNEGPYNEGVYNEGVYNEGVYNVSVGENSVFPDPRAMSASPVSSINASPGGEMRAASRRFWQPFEDVALLATVLAHRHHMPTSPNVRHYWETISQQLWAEHALRRNTRQCRDRFNLLYSRGVRNIACNVAPDSQRDVLILQIAEVFEYTDRGLYRVLPTDNGPRLVPNAEIVNPAANPVTGGGGGGGSGVPPEWGQISSSVASLMASTQKLASDLQNLSERFTQLSNEVRNMQLRMNYGPIPMRRTQSSEAHYETNSYDVNYQTTVAQPHLQRPLFPHLDQASQFPPPHPDQPN